MEEQLIWLIEIYEAKVKDLNNIMDRMPHNDSVLSKERDVYEGVITDLRNAIKRG